MGAKLVDDNLINNDLVEDINIAAIQTLVTPAQLKAELPLSDKARAMVLDGRQTIRNILDGKDNRLFVVIGPCSIHDPVAAHDYADRLKALSEKVKDTLYIVMRVYFEKPRTTVGWKGLVNDPDMNDSFDIEICKTLLVGLQLARVPQKAKRTVKCHLVYHRQLVLKTEPMVV